jgi:hypothetical protein
MKINFVTDSVTNSPRMASIRPMLAKIVQQISADYDVKPNIAYTQMIGNDLELLVNYAKTMFELDVTIWKWMDDQQVIAMGIDIKETPELTKLLLQQ